MAEWNALRNSERPRFIEPVNGKRFELRCSKHSQIQEFNEMPDTKFLQFYHLSDSERGLSGYIFMEEGLIWAF